MTRDEAITIMQVYKEELEHRIAKIDYDVGAIDLYSIQVEAYDMAIEALQTEVVRCKDCIQKHIGGSVTQYYWCDFWDREVDCNNGCSWGERKGGDAE